MWLNEELESIKAALIGWNENQHTHGGPQDQGWQPLLRLLNFSFSHMLAIWHSITQFIFSLTADMLLEWCMILEDLGSTRILLLSQEKQFRMDIWQSFLEAILLPTSIPLTQGSQMLSLAGYTLQMYNLSNSYSQCLMGSLFVK